MKLAIDGKIPKELWILLLVALLALVGASQETIFEVII